MTESEATNGAGRAGRRTIYSVLGAFAVSRAAVIVLLIIGSQITFVTKDFGTIWRTEVSLVGGRVWPEMLRIIMVGDASNRHLPPSRARPASAAAPAASLTAAVVAPDHPFQPARIHRVPLHPHRRSAGLHPLPDAVGPFARRTVRHGLPQQRPHAQQT